MKGLDKFTLRKATEKLSQAIEKISESDDFSESEAALIRTGLRIAIITIQEMARGTERRKRL